MNSDSNYASVVVNGLLRCGPVPDVVSIGYEGREADELVAELAARGVGTVVDVRLNPVSRKRGFSKRQLAARLESAGIDYVHLPALGNPRDNRAAFRAGDPDARARFRRRLEEAEAVAALDELARLADAGVVAVLCLEADHDECHRSAVVDALAARRA
jgi:uncharacterized protein (DUF488 family)